MASDQAGGWPGVPVDPPASLWHKWPPARVSEWKAWLLLSPSPVTVLRLCSWRVWGSLLGFLMALILTLFSKFSCGVGNLSLPHLPLACTSLQKEREDLTDVHGVNLPQPHPVSPALAEAREGSRHRPC